MPNLYPALSDDSEPRQRDPNPDLFWAAPARGHHEVIVNAPDPVVSLAELSAEQVAARWRCGASGCAPTATPPTCI